MIRSVVRYAVWIVGLLTVSSAAWFCWAGYRVLPATDGEVQAPLRKPGSISRDARGIPTIIAADAEDALFLQGFATAQDRLFQMDLLRRKAAGELSEVVGPAALELDVDSRRLRMRHAAAYHTKTMPAPDKAMLAAYARGVNAYMRANQGKLAMEFALMNYDPRPWTITDTVLCGLEMFRSLTTTWTHELQKQSLLEGGDAEKVNLLYPPRTGLEIQPGSNAWAIAGRHTASGKPILAGDPHLQWTLPSTWHAVRIQAPDLHVSGVSLPGVPGVVIGHNQHIAWSVTNLGFDVQDLYQEHVDLQTARYEFQGQQLPLGAEREVLQVRGAKPENLTVAITRHGPLVQIAANSALSLRWMATEAGIFQFPFIELNRAQNWEQFRAALKRFPGPGQNFVYADRDGNIGYQATGYLPIRKKEHRGDVPVPGWNGEFEWTGVVPFEDLPSAYNPADGFVVTANQNPFSDKAAYPVHGDFSPHYRANRIRELLGAREKWTPADMVSIQKDVYSAFSSFLAQQVVAAFDKRKPTNPALPEAVATLRSWNGQMEIGQAAPLILTHVYQRLKKTVVEKASPKKGEVYQDQMSQAVMEKMLRERPASWFDDWDQVLLAALDHAIEDIRPGQGSEPSRWDYGEYNKITIPNPVLGRLPVLGSWLWFANIGPVPMAGSSTTVKQTGRNVGPSMRFTADLADWEGSRLDLTIGESGHLFSPNYKDQWPAYWSGTSTLFAFEKAEAKHVLRFVPE